MQAGGCSAMSGFLQLAHTALAGRDCVARQQSADAMRPTARVLNMATYAVRSLDSEHGKASAAVGYIAPCCAGWSS
jgi:hypothetical protein